MDDRLLRSTMAPKARPNVLSPEEEDCIRFFETTIDSLEDSMDRMDIPARSRDQHIIDLVCPDPDLVPTRDCFSPDFHSLMPNPESHFEIRPIRDPHACAPAGCIPTPVLIAQQIAENCGAGPAHMDPPSLRRLSLDSQPPVKQGPPTSAKPTWIPANISMVLNSWEPQAQTLNQTQTSVSLEDRRAQMLANLSGSSHPLRQDDLDLKVRNLPTRSVSFRDPTPDQTRMEALSKLGLNRTRALSGGPALLDHPDGNTTKLQTGPQTVCPPLDVTSIELNNYGGKSMVVHPSEHRTQSQSSPPGSRAEAPICRTDLPDILSSHLDQNRPQFNRYGGKSLNINPRHPAPAPTPRPLHQSYPAPGGQRRGPSKSKQFRPQSITVEFSGRGPTDETRRAALRTLGLLKD